MFRFTIRDLLLLTVIVALAVGWWMDRAAWSRRLSAAQSELREAAVGYEESKRVNCALMDFLNARGYYERGFPENAFAPKKQ